MPRRNNRVLVREAAQALENFKYEVASELGVNYNGTDPGALSSRQNGYVGGIMVKRMIQAAESSLSGKGGPKPI
jgi:hypothetical protein